MFLKSRLLMSWGRDSLRAGSQAWLRGDPGRARTSLGQRSDGVGHAPGQDSHPCVASFRRPGRGFLSGCSVAPVPPPSTHPHNSQVAATGTHSRGWRQESLPAPEPHRDLFHPEHSQRIHCRREKPRNVKSGTGPRMNSIRRIHSPIFTELFRACLTSALKHQTDNGELRLKDQTAPRQTAIYGSTAGFRHAYKGFLN